MSLKKIQSRESTPSPTDREYEKKKKSLWFAESGSKRWTEIFFLLYSPVWITWALCIIVPFRFFESFKELEYMLVGISAAFPYFLLPLFVVGESDRIRPLKDRHWVKANIWIFIFSFIGNYYWTHYFYTLLGASYTFPSWRLNNVPIPLYLMTHAYFCFYHVISNITLRRFRNFLATSSFSSSKIVSFLIQALWIFVLSYFTATMETLTISNFPYYTFVDKAAMYKYGSLFYAIYFFVSFPMFIRIDERKGDIWTLPRTVIDALGAGMLVTILLDFWRLGLGPIVSVPGLPTYAACLKHGLPWLS